MFHPVIPRGARYLIVDEKGGVYAAADIKQASHWVALGFSTGTGTAQVTPLPDCVKGHALCLTKDLDIIDHHGRPYNEVILEQVITNPNNINATTRDFDDINASSAPWDDQTGMKIQTGVTDGDVKFFLQQVDND